MEDCHYCHKPIDSCECLWRCSLCEKEFENPPRDNMHSVSMRYPTAGGDYIDVDGECGPIIKVN